MVKTEINIVTAKSTLVGYQSLIGQFCKADAAAAERSQEYYEDLQLVLSTPRHENGQLLAHAMSGNLMYATP
jgi:hypothetical protein